MTFKELGITEPILKALSDKGYETPTPIQEQAIPPALSGRDMIGIAQTGTGKTAAFAIPVIQLIEANRTNKMRKIKALVLSPTRELALQTAECFEDYSKYTGLSSTVIFGGVGQQPQIDKLKRGTDVLIATPGRLLDLISQGFISLRTVEHFVLDEADRMLDMGFIHDIRRILPLLPKQRQSLMFSATMPASIEKLSSTILHNPVKVEVTPVASVIDTIAQDLYMVEKPDKRKLLIMLLKDEKRPVLVFSRTKYGADNIGRTLKKKGIDCGVIHGNKSQGARQKALTDFKTGKTRVIIATDIAARGIDIADLELVINYDVPDVAETYVHRIGRTGRAGNRGTAITFCTNDDKPMLRDIEKLTGKRLNLLHADLPQTGNDERKGQQKPERRDVRQKDSKPKNAAKKEQPHRRKPHPARHRRKPNVQKPA